MIGWEGPQPNPKDNHPPDVMDRVRSLDLMPRFPRGGADTSPNTATSSRPAVFAGGGQATVAQPVAPIEAPPNGDGYDLNFENAPVATVAKVILGDILGVGYTIDPRVQGTVTLASGRPVAKSDILFVLPSATYEAYNTWGCKSLYFDKCGGADTVSGSDRAVAVSFDRPLDNGTAQVNRFFGPDDQMVQWLEQQGYNVSYSDDVQTDQNSSSLLPRSTSVLVSTVLARRRNRSGGSRARLTGIAGKPGSEIVA